MKPRTTKPRAAEHRRRGNQRHGHGNRLPQHTDPAATRVGIWGAVLLAMLVVAFTAYGMTVGDHELLGKIWSLISGAVGAIMAWLGLRRT